MRSRDDATPPRVVVIGAGVMGVSIAYHLAKVGARVVVLERAAPGSQATQGAFAMLIAAHDGGGPSLNALYGMAVADWRELAREIGPSMPIQWGGAASWAAPGAGADELAALARRLRDWGAPVQALTSRGLEALVPGIRPGPFGAGCFFPDHGALDPAATLGALVAVARRLGVAFRFPCEVVALSTDGQAITSVLTRDGAVEADVVVLAAGAATPDLAAMVGVRAPINLVSGTLAHSKPFRPVLGCVLNGPHGSLKQDPDGRIVTGADYRPGADGTDTSQAYGEQLLATAARVLPALAGAELDAMTIGYVPIPADGLPVVGFCAAPANLYLALTMSGITLAPLVGRLAASEIVDGIAVDVLAAYRPARFN